MSKSSHAPSARGLSRCGLMALTGDRLWVRGVATRPRLPITASVLAGALLLAACSGGGANPRATARGRQLFVANCALCHGQDAAGRPRLGKSLLQNEFIASSSDEELTQFLIEGRRADDPLNTQGVDMPPRGGNPALSDDDLRRIVAFLRTLG